MIAAVQAWVDVMLDAVRRLQQATICFATSRTMNMQSQNNKLQLAVSAASVFYNVDQESPTHSPRIGFVWLLGYQKKQAHCIIIYI